MTRDDASGRRTDATDDDRTDDATTPRGPSRRRLLRATAGLAVTGSLAGCQGDTGDLPVGGTDTDGGTDGTTDGTGGTADGDELGLPQSSVEALSLAPVGSEEVPVGNSTGRVVAYRRDREPSTAVAGFATAIDDGTKPVGRNLPASELGVDEVTFPAEESPSVDASDAGVFAPASARADGEVAPDELLTLVPGSEMPEEVTVSNENTRVFSAPKFMPSTKWFPGPTWMPGRLWVRGNDWKPGRLWVRGNDWVPADDPESARVVVSGGDRSLEDLGIVDGILGEKLDVGETVTSDNTIFGHLIGPNRLNTIEDVYDAGASAEMGGAGAGVAMIADPNNTFEGTDMTGMLTSQAGKRALALAGATDADGVEWLAGPTRLDDTDHFNPENHAYGGEFFMDVAPEEVVTYGGVVAGDSGPWAVIGHVADCLRVTFVGVDATPIDSTAPFEEAALDHVFPASRLHRSRGFLWTAGGGEIQAGEAATATPTPDCGQTTIDENVTTDTTLRKGCTYTLSGAVDIVDGATLTIEPGVTVEAEEASRLLVDDGALVAKGTEEDPIEIRGTSSPAPEHWKGIVVESYAEANELDHVSVSDAGRYNSHYEANLAIGSRNPARMTVRNCEFTYSSAAGVRVEKEGTLTGFGNNRFADNQGPPLDIKSDDLVVLEGSSTFDDGYVLVRIGKNNAIETDTTLPDMGIPYRMNNNVSNYVILDATVEIEPGSRFEFESGTGLLVDSGALVAVGESDNRIQFVGENDQPGHWRGIVVRSNAEANELDNVLLSDAGAYSGYPEANLCIGPRNPGRMTVRNSTISDSASWGVRLVNGQLDSRKNVYKNNAEGGITGLEE